MTRLNAPGYNRRPRLPPRAECMTRPSVTNGPDDNEDQGDAALGEQTQVETALDEPTQRGRERTERAEHFGILKAEN